MERRKNNEDQLHTSKKCSRNVGIRLKSQSLDKSSGLKITLQNTTKNCLTQWMKEFRDCLQRIYAQYKKTQNYFCHMTHSTGWDKQFAQIQKGSHANTWMCTLMLNTLKIGFVRPLTVCFLKVALYRQLDLGKDKTLQRAQLKATLGLNYL